MRKKNVTSLDVARLAGVSQSTISRVFSPGASVSEKTRKKVLQAAKQLGYKPNAIARGLITDSTRIIGFVAGNAINPFYDTVLDEFTTQLLRKGYYLLYLKTEHDEIGEEDIAHYLEYKVDGLIIANASLSSPAISLFEQYEIPIVLFNRYTDKSDHFNVVSCNNFHAGYQIGKYLLHSGHKDIAYMAGVDYSSTNRDRLTGFRQALEEHGYEINNIVQGNYSYHGGFHAGLKLLKNQKDIPDAIFCANDLMALGTIDAMKSIGLKVPDDVSIIGFDDSYLAKLPPYSLTTWQQPIKEMVETGINILFDKINGKQTSPVKKLIEGKLMVRKTLHRRK